MREFGLQFILMRDNQFACWTVPTGLAEDCQVATFHVDQKRKLPEIHQLLTSRASAEADIRIWIQCERILRRQPPKTVLVHTSPNILAEAAMTHKVVTTQYYVYFLLLDIMPCPMKFDNMQVRILSGDRLRSRKPQASPDNREWPLGLQESSLELICFIIE